MSKMKIALLSLAVVIVVSAVGVAPAMAFKAFVAKAAVGQIKGKQTESELQIFKTKNGEVKCNIAEATGTVAQLKATTQVLQFKYRNCTAFLLKAVISIAKYLFNINGAVELENEVIVKTAGCELKIPATQRFGANSIIYENFGQGLKGKSDVSGITYHGEIGSVVCPNSGSDGVYTGGETLEGDNPPAAIGVE
jgi:hypothetical protein